MQSLWSIKDLDWDHKIHEEKMVSWRKYREQLHLLERIKVPRWIGTDEVIDVQLHAFGDASNAAYAAVVYFRVVKSDESISVRLISTKTKVSPVLNSRLLDKVKSSLKLNNLRLFLYSDNSTVLAWIMSHPNHFNTFVANRITETQSLLNPNNWSFVATEENPADCASRGVYPEDLKSHDLWWSGPKWLSMKQSEWPSNKHQVYNTELERRKLPSNVSFATKEKSSENEYLVGILKKHSSLSRLLWNTARIVKFCNLRKAMSPNEIGLPTALDMRDALRCWIRYIQHLEFRDEI